MNDVKHEVRQMLAAAIAEAVPAFADTSVALERPKQAAHGDYASNVAMALAKRAQRNPRQLAEALIAALPPSPLIDRAEIAGAGFINIFLTPKARQSVVARILQEGAQYGQVATPSGKHVMVEFVSANPTGPLHVGHGRQAALGDAIASLLETQGHAVTREYY